MIALNNFEETCFSTFVRENDAVNDGFFLNLKVGPQSLSWNESLKTGR